MGRQLNAVIDDLGFGYAQWSAVVLGGGVWLADGAELLLIGSVTRSVAEDWGLNAAQRGLVVSIVFVGVLLGNSMSGGFGDVCGRRIPIIMSYFAIVVFSVLSAYAWGIWSMVLFRVLVGWSFGVGQPAWNTLGTEISPVDYRVSLNGLGQIAFCVGEMYAAVLIWAEDPQMKEMDWRRLLILGALPSGVLCVLAYFFLLESPQFLAAKGRKKEADAVLQKMKEQNNMPHVDIDFTVSKEAKPETHSLMYHARLIFGRHMIFTTLAVSFTCFVLNFNFYGGLYAFPQVLPTLDLRWSPAANVTLGAAVEFPGFLLGMYIGSRVTRKNGLLVYLFGSIVSVAIFLHGSGYITGVIHPDWTMIGYLGMKILVDVGFVVTYIYACEIYPTVARTSGSGICISAGRLGSIMCPLVFELTAEWSGSYHFFFIVIVALSVVNVALVLFLTIETSGKHLHDDIDETEPLGPI